MAEIWKELWKSAGFTLGILRSKTPVMIWGREIKKNCSSWFNSVHTQQKRIKRRSKKRVCRLHSHRVERLSGRRALLKTAASPAANTWLNPKSRSYALQGGSGSIGQGARAHTHRRSNTQFTPPAFLWGGGWWGFTRVICIVLFYSPNQLKMWPIQLKGCQKMSPLKSFVFVPFIVIIWSKQAMLIHSGAHVGLIME